eukprot:768590-Hanusia_phi.AAC.19
MSDTVPVVLTRSKRDRLKGISKEGWREVYPGMMGDFSGQVELQLTRGGWQRHKGGTRGGEEKKGRRGEEGEERRKRGGEEKKGRRGEEGVERRRRGGEEKKGRRGEEGEERRRRGDRTGENRTVEHEGGFEHRTGQDRTGEADAGEKWSKHLEG